MDQKTTKENIARNLAKKRKEAGLTQGQLCEILNYSDKSVSAWERGESMPDIITLYEIANYYSVNVDYFYKDHKYDKYSTTAIKKQKNKEQLMFNKQLKIVALIVFAIWLASIICFVPMIICSTSSSYLIFLYALTFTFVPLIPYGFEWKNKALIISSEAIFTVFLPISLFLSIYYWSGQSIELPYLSIIFLIIIPFSLLFIIMDLYFFNNDF